VRTFGKNPVEKEYWFDRIVRIRKVCKKRFRKNDHILFVKSCAPHVGNFCFVIKPSAPESGPGMQNSRIKSVPVEDIHMAVHGFDAADHAFEIRTEIIDARLLHKGLAMTLHLIILQQENQRRSGSDTVLHRLNGNKFSRRAGAHDISTPRETPEASGGNSGKAPGIL
jgi:hypothetical protein